MRLQIQVPKSCKAEAMDLLEKLQADVESRDFSSSQVGTHKPSYHLQHNSRQHASIVDESMTMCCNKLRACNGCDERDL